MREIKFRTWSKASNNWEDSDDFAISCVCPSHNYEGGAFVCSSAPNGQFDFYYPETDDEYIVQQFTGLKDINNKEIYEGDIVAVYPENYEQKLIDAASEDEGLAGLPVYEVDMTKPLPIKDVVLFKGEVVYNAPEFAVKVRPNTSGKSIIGMRDYWFEVIGDVFENS